MGGRNTVEHHDHFIKLGASCDAEAAARESGQHWERLAVEVLGGSVRGRTVVDVNA